MLASKIKSTLQRQSHIWAQMKELLDVQSKNWFILGYSHFGKRVYLRVYSIVKRAYLKYYHSGIHTMCQIQISDIFRICIITIFDNRKAMTSKNEVKRLIKFIQITSSLPQILYILSPSIHFIINFYLLQNLQDSKRLRVAQGPYIAVRGHQIQTDILQTAKILMKEDYLSSPQLSEEQKQIPSKLTLTCQLFPPEAPLFPIQRSDRFSSQKQQVQREESSSKTGKKGKRGGQERKNVNRGHWSLEQNKKYHWFLEIHYEHFVNRHMRRTDRIFKTMQLFIGSRQAEQCRSHHQKMEKKYLSFIAIITNLRQIHYLTQDTAQMAAQIESYGITTTDPLATVEKLKTQKRVEDEVALPPLKKQAKPQKQPKTADKGEQAEGTEKLVVEQSEYKERQIVFNPTNMFEESRNNIGDIQMYHEKEDHSCIFQAMFQHQY